MLAPFLIMTMFALVDEPKTPVDNFKPEVGWRDISKGAKTVWFDPKERKLILLCALSCASGAGILHVQDQFEGT